MQKLLQNAISIAGNITQLATKINADCQNILDWGNGKEALNPLHAMKIEKATGGKIKARDLLPDYHWDDLERSR